MKVFCFPTVAMFKSFFDRNLSDDVLAEKFTQVMRFSCQGYEKFMYCHNKNQSNSYFSHKSCKNIFEFQYSEIYHMLCGLEMLDVENLVALVTLKIDIKNKRCLNEREIKVNICYSKDHDFHVFYEYTIRDFFAFMAGKKEFSTLLSTATKDANAWKEFFETKIQTSLLLPVREVV